MEMTKKSLCKIFANGFAKILHRFCKKCNMPVTFTNRLYYSEFINSFQFRNVTSPLNTFL